MAYAYYLSMMMLVVGSIHGMESKITPNIICNSDNFEKWLLQETKRCPQALEELLAAIKVNTGRWHCVHYYLDEKRKVKAIASYSYQRLSSKDEFDTFHVTHNPSYVIHTSLRARL